MARTYLAFLGTNDYLPCTYCFGEEEVAGVRFVQEATVHFFCRDWGAGDRILILATPQAEEKNWRNDGHRDRDGHPLRREGLAGRLQRLGPAARVERALIPEGKDEGEIWEIFQVLYRELGEGDRVVFDITHALRHIPMLALVALNYAKVLKQVSVAGIYYGAFEVLGPQREVEKIPVPDRRAPIFDLTPFDTLLAWGVAVDRFLGAGEAGPVAALAHGAVEPILRQTQGKDAAARAIRGLASSLQAFTRAVATCRGPRLRDRGAKLRQDLEAAQKLEVLPPLQPLLGRMAQRLPAFEGDWLRDGLKAAQWCLDHNLIQQGFTILQEFLVSWVAVSNELAYQHKAHRELVTQAVTIARNALPEEEWLANARKHADQTRRLLAFLGSAPWVGKIFGDLSQWRNDLNHAAFISDPRSGENFPKKLQDLIETVTHHLER